jgi:hypothetical protein
MNLEEFSATKDQSRPANVSPRGYRPSLVIRTGSLRLALIRFSFSHVVIPNLFNSLVVSLSVTQKMNHETSDAEKRERPPKLPLLLPLGIISRLPTVFILYRYR